MRTLKDLIRVSFQNARLEYDEQDPEFETFKVFFSDRINEAYRLMCKDYCRLLYEQEIRGNFKEEDLDVECLGVEGVYDARGNKINYDRRGSEYIAPFACKVVYRYYPGDMKTLNSVCDLQDDVADALTLHAARRFYETQGSGKKQDALYFTQQFGAACDMALAQSYSAGRTQPKLKKAWDYIG